MQLSKQSTKRSLKRISNGQTSSPLQLSSASMIDVVFLLLIFFLVTTSFRTPTQSVITPIVSSAVAPATVSVNDVEKVTLAVGNQSGKIGYEMGGVQTSDLSNVRKLLKELKPESVQILVKIGDEIPFQSAISVIALCKTCGHETAAWFPNHER